MTEHDSGDPRFGHGRGGRESGSGRAGGGTEADEIASPADLPAIQADDTLLDALGGAEPRGGDDLGDAELSALLLAWRRDVDSEPMPELVDTPEAVTTVRTAAIAQRHGHRGRRRMLVPVAAAAAVLAIGFTGTALAARDAQPGDTLWGLSTVLYSDHARSVEAAASVRTDLEQAHLAIAQERYDDARTSLDQAEQALNKVAVEEQLERLRARHAELRAQLDSPDEEPRSTPTRTTGETSTENPNTVTSTDSPPSSTGEKGPPESDETPSDSSTSSPTSSEPTSSSSPDEDESTSDETSGESRDDTSSPGGIGGLGGAAPPS